MDLTRWLLDTVKYWAGNTKTPNSLNVILADLISIFSQLVTFVQQLVHLKTLTTNIK